MYTHWKKTGVFLLEWDFSQRPHWRLLTVAGVNHEETAHEWKWGCHYLYQGGHRWDILQTPSKRKYYFPMQFFPLWCPKPVWWTDVSYLNGEWHQKPVFLWSLDMWSLCKTLVSILRNIREAFTCIINVLDVLCLIIEEVVKIKWKWL